MANILIVDDKETNLKILNIMLTKQGYKVIQAQSAKEALDIIEEKEKNFFDLILTDINMPEISGFEFFETLKEDRKYRQKCFETPVIFVSALTDKENIEHGLKMGGIDYITKPYNLEEVKLRVSNHIKVRNEKEELKNYNETLETKVQEQNAKLEEIQMSVIFSLAKLAQSRDDDTGNHLERVREFCKILAVELLKNEEFESLVDKNFIDNIYNASPLHDIGKVGISDLILLKPDRLNDEEYEVMKTHTIIGAKTLNEVNEKYKGNSFIEMGILIARHHHERWDGTGYPDKLANVQIPLCARIMAIADVYDALVSKRVYKPAFSHEKSVEIIKDGAGTQFDPLLVKIFLDTEKQFKEVSEK